MTDYVVFDLETVPDLDMARRLLGLDAEVPDAEVRSAIGMKYARADQDPRELFLKPPFHRIVCIGAVFARREEDGPFAVRSLGARHIGEKGEAKLIGDFVTGLARDGAGKGPVLVSFNGGGFDLPVLRYRALAHSVAVPGLFQGLGRDYWYRFGRDHIDLCDLLSGFGASARPSLNEMAALLGVPSKLDGLDGSKIEAAVNAGALEEVAGTRLIREWQGVEHVVTVTTDGYEWQGRPYKSLSAIARAITGTRWNGWVFFGLKNQRGRV